MPKVEYTKAKGLVQSTGSGFALNAIQHVSGDITLDRGTCVCIVNGGTNPEITLPTAASDGDVLILIDDNADSILKNTGTQLGGDVTFNAKGDGAVCVYDGTEWQVMVSNG